MAVNTTEIGTVFDSMMTKVSTQLNTAYTADYIGAEQYAKVLETVLPQLMQISAQTVQQQPQVDAQVAKINADTSFVGTQQTELTNSVAYNNKIKALDSYSDMIGTMGAGSLTISSNMWTAYFTMLNSLGGTSTPTDTTITKVV